MPRKYKIPAEITQPFASRIDGVWAGHVSSDAAWVRFEQAWSAGRAPRNSLVLRVTEPGYGVKADEPAERAYGNRSGQHVSPRRKLRGSDEQWARLDADAAAAEVDWQTLLWTRALG